MTRRGKTLAGDLQALQEAILGLWRAILAAADRNAPYLFAAIVITLPVILAMIIYTDPK